MPRPRSAPKAPPPRASEVWVELTVRIPPAWKGELEELARARALSVAALVRQLIRELILRRHEATS